MPRFTYCYIDKSRQKQYSTIEAADLNEAESNLDIRNIPLLEIHQHISEDANLLKGAKVPGKKVLRRDLVEFCIYMSTLADAGLSLTGALSEYSAESQHVTMKYISDTLKSEVENGKTLSESLARFPKVFTNEFVYLVKAGEQTGTLPNAFKEIKSYLEWLERVSGDVKQATTYPMFLSIALGIFVLFLFSNVVPKITKILIDMKLELPLITKIIIFISNVAINTWYIWIAAGIAMPLLYNLIIKKNQAFMLIADSVKLELPIFGTLIRLLIQARFTHNFAILHRAGISVLENIELCKGFIGNSLFQKALIKASSDVQQGITLSASLRSSGLFNGLVLRMFAVGEASGDLENSLNHASLYYDEEVPRRVKRVFSILEPMIIIVLVGIIGAVALAILLPIMSISQGLGG